MVVWYDTIRSVISIGQWLLVRFQQSPVNNRPVMPLKSIGTDLDAKAVKHVSNPVSNTRTHCSRPMSQIRNVLLFPPAMRQPEDCTQLRTIPGPLA